jgi:uncharacterized integral membrane protein
MNKTDWSAWFLPLIGAFLIAIGIGILIGAAVYNQATIQEKTEVTK